jgi:aminomethyltransferase
MPVQYSGILEEHRAVRERVGIFDVSHMGELEFTGKDAAVSLQTLTPNDVSKLGEGRCHYSSFLTDRGTFVDDLLVYRRSGDSYLLVVNAGNTPKDFEWARTHASGNLRVENRSDDYALIAAQGPLSAELLAASPTQTPPTFTALDFEMRVLGEKALGLEDRLHAGEDGFEITSLPNRRARLSRSPRGGETLSESPVRASARETRCVSKPDGPHANDIDETVTPWEADL